jgi:hypothetical protein
MEHLAMLGECFGHAIVELSLIKVDFFGDEGDIV